MENPMPIRAKPYKHQREAFEFALRLFGLTEGGDAETCPLVRSSGCALLCEMGTG